MPPTTIPVGSQPQQPQSFRPLEYWKAPKPVQHIRKKSSAIFASTGISKSPGPDKHSFANLEDGIVEDREPDKKDISVTTIRDMAWGGKNDSNFQMTDDYGRDGYSNPAWYNFRYWGKKAWATLVAIIVAILIIIVVVAVVETRANRYPDYITLPYLRTDTFSGAGFFDNFDYFTGYDTSQGFVHYVPAAQANQLNLTHASDSSAVLRVDTSVGNTSQPDASTGRFSVRITSKKQYGVGNLFVFDVKHSPIGCGTWPALWLSDPNNWPTNGEIDVMEAVNVVNTANNQMTLHTSPDCSMGVKRKETGKVLTTSCVNSTDNNAGCGVDASNDKSTFGNTFNSNGGGVLAMEIQNAGIRMWQFSRANTPSDIWTSPNPNFWGEATADFPNTDCNIGNHFRNQSIIANIDLCGSWAGQQSVYSQNCPLNCTDYVQNYPQAFTDAFWEFGQFSVFSAQG